MIREKFKEFIKKWVESSAEQHIECWKDYYFGKTKSQIEEDVYINYDDSLEREFVETEFKGATDEEIEYYIECFNKEVIKQLGHGETITKVYILFETDPWLSTDSMTIIGIFDTKDKLIDTLTNEIFTENLTSDDINNLKNINQTQGRDNNYMIQEMNINEIEN